MEVKEIGPDGQKVELLSHPSFSVFFNFDFLFKEPWSAKLLIVEF